jgi:hypothetical protein
MSSLWKPSNSPISAGGQGLQRQLRLRRLDGPGRCAWRVGFFGVIGSTVQDGADAFPSRCQAGDGSVEVEQVTTSLGPALGRWNAVRTSLNTDIRNWEADGPPGESAT